jgi:hypothetical protein
MTSPTSQEQTLSSQRLGRRRTRCGVVLDALLVVSALVTLGERVRTRRE